MFSEQKTNGAFKPDLDRITRPVVKREVRPTGLQERREEMLRRIDQDLSGPMKNTRTNDQVVRHNITVLKSVNKALLYQVYGVERVDNAGKRLQDEIFEKVHQNKLNTEQIFGIIVRYLTCEIAVPERTVKAVTYNDPIIAHNMASIKAMDCSILFNDYDKDKVLSHDLALQNYILQGKYRQRMDKRHMFDMLSKSLNIGLRINGVEADIVQYGAVPTFVVGREGIIGLIRKAFGKEIKFNIYYDDQLDSINREPEKDEVVPFKTEGKFASVVRNTEEAQNPALIQISLIDSDVFENLYVCNLDLKAEIAQKRNAPNSPWKKHRLEMLKKTALKAFAKTHTANRGLYKDFALIYNEIEDGLITNNTNNEE